MATRAYECVWIYLIAGKATITRTTKAHETRIRNRKRKFPLESSVCLFVRQLSFSLPHSFSISIVFHFEAFVFDAELVCCSWVRLPLVNFYFRSIQICKLCISFICDSHTFRCDAWILLFKRTANRQQLFLVKMKPKMWGKGERIYRSQVWVLSPRRRKQFLF